MLSFCYRCKKVTEQDLVKPDDDNPVPEAISNQTYIYINTTICRVCNNKFHNYEKEGVSVNEIIRIQDQVDFKLTKV